MSLISILLNQKPAISGRSDVDRIVLEKNLEFRQHTFFLLYAALILASVVQTLVDPGVILPGTILLAILIACLFLGTTLAGKSLPLPAGILWATGINLFFLAVVVTSGDAARLPLMIIPSFILGVLLGPGNAVVATLTWALFLLFFTSYPNTSLAFPPEGLISPVFGAAVAGFIGGFVQKLFFDQVSSLANLYLHSQRSLEEARNNQLEYNQVKEDLLFANNEMARLTERLRGLSQVAETARQAKEEFVANVSHELRTPLNMIIGFTETITRNPALYGVRLPKKLFEDLTIIERNSRHLSELINDVLDLSQVEAGHMTITRERTNFRKIIQESVDQVRPLFQAKSLYLHVDLPGGDAPVYCDETRFKEVLINLISNAGRFTMSGGVTITLDHREKEYVVSVQDTGPGIPETQLEAIFEPFRQLDGIIRRQYGGTGLGLTISKHFVEMHEGRIWAESTVGQGSTFYFSLPYDPQKNAFTPSNRRWINPYNNFLPRTRRFKAPLPTLNPRFLVYEQGQALAEIIKRYMDQTEIAVARTQDEIREALKTPSTGVLINTADISGEEVKQIAKMLPLGTLLFTCFIPGMQEFARRMGVVDYLIKPISKDQLLSIIELYGPEAETILFVDDQPEMLQLLSRFIDASEKKYQPQFAANGKEALEMIHNQPPDLLILDLVMPEMDGFAVIQELQRDPRYHHIPVIVLSSRDPVGSPVISNALQVIKVDGYTVNDLTASIQLLSDLLAFNGAPSVPALPKAHPE